MRQQIYILYGLFCNTSDAILSTIDYHIEKIDRYFGIFSIKQPFEYKSKLYNKWLERWKIDETTIDEKYLTVIRLLYSELYNDDTNVRYGSTPSSFDRISSREVSEANYDGIEKIGDLFEKHITFIEEKKSIYNNDGFHGLHPNLHRFIYLKYGITMTIEDLIKKL